MFSPGKRLLSLNDLDRSYPLIPSQRAVVDRASMPDVVDLQHLVVAYYNYHGTIAADAELLIVRVFEWLNSVWQSTNGGSMTPLSLLKMCLAISEGASGNRREREM